MVYVKACVACGHVHHNVLACHVGRCQCMELQEEED